MKKIFNYKKGFTQHHLCNSRKTDYLFNSYSLSRSSGAGFTLIELLVVIAIIGILTTFLVANFVGVKSRARDGQRKSDLRNIQAALEIYRSDKSVYPSSIPGCGTTWQDGAAVYMQSVPCDPLNTVPFNYRYTPTAGTYKLIGCLENTSDSQKDTTSTAPCDDTAPYDNWSFTLKNP
ncbi:MAG: prepilin-type N-terminal cleavage/methylation domain-containing protein [Patescibacteria group bacterium]